MKIVNFSTRRPVSIVIIVSVILILGFFSFSRTSVDLLPEMNFPMACYCYPGPGRKVEPGTVVEGSLNSLNGVTEIQSNPATAAQ